MSSIFTAASLQNRSLPELRSLFAQAQRDLVRSAPRSPERCKALANLEAISLAIASSMAGPRP